jgi:hypothetical protein
MEETTKMAGAKEKIRWLNITRIELVGLVGIEISNNYAAKARPR